MTEVKVKMNKLVYLSFNILVLSKTEMYEVLFDSIIHIKTEDFFDDIKSDVDKKIIMIVINISRKLQLVKTKTC